MLVPTAFADLLLQYFLNHTGLDASRLLITANKILFNDKRLTVLPLEYGADRVREVWAVNGGCGGLLV